MFVIIHFLKTLCSNDEKLSHTLFYSIPLNATSSLKIQWLEIRQKSQLFNLKKGQMPTKCAPCKRKTTKTSN